MSEFQAPQLMTLPNSQPVMTAADWVVALNLQPHPEGGYFRETYRAAESIPLAALPARFREGLVPAASERVFSTAIYYLLEAGQFSALHRIKSDEFWHFYAGTGLTVEIISPDGLHSQLQLGARPDQGQVFQGVVKAGAWFGAAVSQPHGYAQPQGYALVGCTVAPGFDFADFEMAERQQLLNAFPQHQALITRFTRK
jgi:uncharacterized protein